jgi:hypothetical protein
LTPPAVRRDLLTPRARANLIGFIAAAVLLAFVVVYLGIFSATLGYALTPNAVRPDNPPSWIESPEILSISTGLTGLVGGVVAVALGQNQTGSPTSQQEANTNQNGWFRRWLEGLTTVEGGKRFLAILYAVLHTVLGLGAAAV